MKKGFTLIETIIVIAILGTIIAILSTTVLTVRLLDSSSKKTVARSLLEEELSVLHSLPFADLANRTNARFLGVLHKRGSWLTETSTGTPSAPNALALKKTSPIYKDFSGLIAIPYTGASNFTLSARLKMPTSSPSGWGAGFLARARDLENHYRILFRENAIKLEREQNGARTELSSDGVLTALNTWYKLEVQGTADTIKIYLNDLLIRTAGDPAFAFGQFALFGANDSEPIFDDVVLITSTSTTWNFDSDTAGKTPAQWAANSPYDLRSGIDLLTISDFLGSSSIKHIKAQIDWRDNITTSSIKVETLISQ